MQLYQNIAKTPIGNGTQTRVVSLKDKTNEHPSLQFFLIVLIPALHVYKLSSNTSV